MADSKISDLAAVTDVQAADAFVLARAGTSKKITGASLASELGGGGSLPDWWTVGADSDFTMRPTDQTGDSPFLNMLYDASELVDQSNYGYVMNVRPVGSAPGDGDELFSLSVIGMIFRSAPDEGSAIFRVKSSDYPTASSQFGIGASGDAFFKLLPEGGGGDDQVRLQAFPAADTDFRLPHLPTSDPGLAGQVWNDAGTLKVSP